VFFALSGKRVVLAGGSHAAAWKAELMSAAGARVEVYAEDFSEEMRAVATGTPDGDIVLIERIWTRADIAGAAMAIGAFEDDGDAATFARAARAAGVPINVIDKPAFCDFSFGAIVNRSPLVVGISTDGAAPVFAQAIRAKLEALLPTGFAHWAAAASRWRDKVKATGLSFAGRRKFWQVFTAHAMTHAEAAPSEGDFDRFVSDVKGLGSTVETGTVTLVGAGPGDPELLTLRAVRALQSADVILFDDLVSSGVLDFARREARKLLVGKTGFGPSCKQEDINALMVSLAKQGKRVVRLKGGDPLIFGRAGEELDACEAIGIKAEIVPGITAAQGAAASLGLSLTDRKHSRRLQYITGHARSGALPDDDRLARAGRSGDDHGDLHASAHARNAGDAGAGRRSRSGGTGRRHRARDSAGPAGDPQHDRRIAGAVGGGTASWSGAGDGGSHPAAARSGDIPRRRHGLTSSHSQSLTSLLHPRVGRWRMPARPRALRD